MNVEECSMTMILHAGQAKANIHEALQAARDGNFAETSEKMKEAKEELMQAHKQQTKLLQEDAQQRFDNFPILLIHAQDHLMTVMSEKDLIEEMIAMYRKQHNLEKKVDQLLHSDDEEVPK
jgi:PTS system cellobiose-specific IIA component